MGNNCNNCKYIFYHTNDEPCEICNSNFDMWEANDANDVVKEIDHPLKKYDLRDFENVLQCLSEAVNGLHWRMENEPTTMDDSDYDKYEEWIAELKKYPREFWADCMLDNKEEND